MRVWRRFGRAAGAALAVVVGLSALAAPAAAQSDDWKRALGPGYGSSFTGPDPGEREFIREWEMSPEAGLPTFSPGNIVRNHPGGSEDYGERPWPIRVYEFSVLRRYACD